MVKDLGGETLHLVLLAIEPVEEPLEDLVLPLPLPSLRLLGLLFAAA